MVLNSLKEIDRTDWSRELIFIGTLSMEALFTLSAPIWQWVVGVAVALYIWETALEHVWYRFKHWVTNTPHKK